MVWFFPFKQSEPPNKKKQKKTKQIGFPRQENPHKAANSKLTNTQKASGFWMGKPHLSPRRNPQPPSSPGARLISSELLGGIEQGAAVLPHRRQDHLFPGRESRWKKQKEKVGKKRKLEKH